MRQLQCSGPFRTSVQQLHVSIVVTRPAFDMNLMVQPNAAVALPDQHSACRLAGSHACCRHSRVEVAVSATAGSTGATSRRSVLLATTVLLPLGSSCAEAATAGPLQQQQQQQQWLRQQLRRTQHAVCLADVQADYDRCGDLSYDKYSG